MKEKTVVKLYCKNLKNLPELLRKLYVLVEIIFKRGGQLRKRKMWESDVKVKYYISL